MTTPHGDPFACCRRTPRPTPARSPLSWRRFRPARRLGVAFSGGVTRRRCWRRGAVVLGRTGVVALLAGVAVVGVRRAGDRAPRRCGGGRVPGGGGDARGEVPAYRANDADRCYHCKNEFFYADFGEAVAEQALDAVAYGENADDAVALDRPGARAASEHRVLRAAGGRGAGEGTRPGAGPGPSACRWPHVPAALRLASRIPHGQEVTPPSCARSSRTPSARCGCWGSATAASGITAEAARLGCRPASWGGSATRRGAGGGAAGDPGGGAQLRRGSTWPGCSRGRSRCR